MFLSPVRFHIIDRACFNNFKGRKDNELLTYQKDTFQKSKLSLKRGQILDDGEIYTSGSTEFFRFDIDWNKFSEYLEERFKNFDKVNTFDYACSDGSEAYSLSMMMQHKFKNKAKKFFPIYAKDLDEDRILKNIENQKTGTINHQIGVKQIANTIDIDAQTLKKEYVTVAPRLVSKPEKIYSLKEKVTEPVQFSAANILEDIENIDSNTPSIIICRNMWPYVDSCEYPDFANTLYERLKEGSIVVLGAFDCFFDKIYCNNSEKISKALSDAGFTPAKTNINKNGYNLIYEKN